MSFINKFKSKFENLGQKKSQSDATPRDEKEMVEEKPVKAKEAVVVKTNKKAKANKVTGEAYRVLVHPHVSEKTAILAHSGKYVFIVSPDATKLGVKRAVLATYGTMPERVQIQKSPGKAVRFGKSYGRRKDLKKAIVTMPKGKTLPIYE